MSKPTRQPVVLARELNLIKYLTGWGMAAAWGHFRRGEFAEAQQRIDRSWRAIYTSETPLRAGKATKDPYGAPPGSGERARVAAEKLPTVGQWPGA